MVDMNILRHTGKSVVVIMVAAKFIKYHKKKIEKKEGKEEDFNKQMHTIYKTGIQ